MGSIINRGTRSEPKWYVKYQENGRQKMVRARVTSKKKAAGFLRAAEQRVADGLVGVEQRRIGEDLPELAAHWLKTHSATPGLAQRQPGARMKHLTKELGQAAGVWRDGGEGRPPARQDGR